MASNRISILLMAAALVGCAGAVDGVVDQRLNGALASETSTERSLADWIGRSDVEQVCFLDEYVHGQNALNYYAAKGHIAPDLPLDGFTEGIPEGALGVLMIRADGASLALVSMRYLFVPNACFGTEAMLRRSAEDPSRWEVEGERLDWR